MGRRFLLWAVGSGSGQWQWAVAVGSGQHGVGLKISNPYTVLAFGR
jgi:hypothetical protein